MSAETTTRRLTALPVAQLGPGVLALAIVVAGAWIAAAVSGPRMALLWVIGAGLGLALHRSGFGFTFGFRRLLASRDATQVRAQLLLLTLLVASFFPLLAAGGLAGWPVRGFVMPIGVELVIGAFLFGVGMQIGGGCASGTLYTVGGGSVRMLLTLLFFVIGATLAAWTYESWSALPTLPAVSLLQTFGLWPALALHLAVFGALWLLLRRVEGSTGRSIWEARSTPWSYGVGAVVLALLCIATLIVAGRPWAITQAFALWGSWGVEALRIDDPAFWPFWEDPTRVDALHRPAFADAMTVMDLGLVAGALASAALAGRFAPTWRVAPGAAAGSVVGGLLLGLGAIMATGCNISAFVSGIASGSLHGWIWILAALPGNALGLRLRPLFGLTDSP